MATLHNPAAEISPADDYNDDDAGGAMKTPSSRSEKESLNPVDDLPPLVGEEDGDFYDGESSEMSSQVTGTSSPAAAAITRKLSSPKRLAEARDAMMAEEVEEEEARTESKKDGQSPSPSIQGTQKKVFDYVERMRCALYEQGIKLDPTYVTMVRSAVMCLFGGKFFYSTLAYETVTQWVTFHPEALKALTGLAEAMRTNTTVAPKYSDQYNDAKRYWVTRKFVAMAMILNPRHVGILAADAFKVTLVVSAALRFKLLRVVILGTLLGDEVTKSIEKVAKKRLSALMPESYKKWLPLLFRTCARLAGSLIAWMSYSYLAPLITAIRGATMFATGFRNWCKKHDQSNILEGYKNDAFTWGTVIFGLYVQLFVWPALPLPLRMLFLPVLGLEWLLNKVSI